MNQLVTEARALCEGATKGPWTLIKEGRYEDHDECRIDLPDDNIELCRYENGDLVARSRTLLPEMAAEIERLEAELDAANTKIEKVHKALDYADRCRFRVESMEHLAVTNGLALGKIAIALQHDFKGKAEALAAMKEDAHDTDTPHP